MLAWGRARGLPRETTWQVSVVTAALAILEVLARTAALAILEVLARTAALAVQAAMKVSAAQELELELLGRT
jgi:hypothetical protein